MKPVSPDPAPDSVVSREPIPDVPDLTYIPGSDRDASEIMRDFGQPISTLPVMDSNQSVLGQDGKVYYPGEEGGLFTGKLRELYPDGRNGATLTGGRRSVGRCPWHPMPHRCYRR